MNKKIFILLIIVLFTIPIGLFITDSCRHQQELRVQELIVKESDDPIEIDFTSYDPYFSTTDGQLILEGGDYAVESQLSVEFYSDDGDKLVGKLWFGDGIMKFEGDMEESAEIFFEQFLKRIADNYINERLELCRSELMTKAIMTGNFSFMPFVNSVFDKDRQ